MWSLLEERAKDKVVLLTTHFMDEADILAGLSILPVICLLLQESMCNFCYSYFTTDYKAIMTKGKLRCAGTSLFLKNRFGIGYHLT
jgi:ATP-binding cassette subfamily A (ABC1) protein 5